MVDDVELREAEIIKGYFAIFFYLLFVVKNCFMTSLYFLHAILVTYSIAFFAYSS